MAVGMAPFSSLVPTSATLSGGICLVLYCDIKLFNQGVYTRLLTVG